MEPSRFFRYWASVFKKRLFFYGSANRASACASAAGNASLSINNVLTVAGSDRANRALCFASAASNASILNNVGHGDTSYNMRYIYYTTLYSKCNC